MYCSGHFISIDMSWAMIKQCIDKDGLVCEGISQAYMDFWVCRALNFMTGPKTVQDCCKVGAVSLKSDGESVNTPQGMYQSGITKCITC
jgi:hypothetical protein